MFLYEVEFCKARNGELASVAIISAFARKLVEPSCGTGGEQETIENVSASQFIQNVAFDRTESMSPPSTSMSHTYNAIMSGRIL